MLVDLSNDDFNTQAGTYTNANGVGMFYGGAGGGALRGGQRATGTPSHAGAFTLLLLRASNFSCLSCGFRCVYRPSN